MAAPHDPHTERLARRHRLARFVRREPFTAAAVGLLVLVLAVTCFPGWFTPIDPLDVDSAGSLQSPSWSHLLGTDRIGRDVLARMIHGASASVPAALLATAISVGLGVSTGLLAASLGGWVDALVMRLLDSLMAVPGLLIVFAFIAALGNGIISIAVAVGVGGSVSFCRLMRAEVYRVRTFMYVEAARASGVRSTTIARRHVIPAAIRPVVALTALNVGWTLLAIGAIGYLGFGTQPPAPEWGAMIADGQRYLSTAWWLSVAPGVVLLLVVLSANQIARYIQRGND